LINTDPYGRGWLFDVAVDEAALAGQLDALLDGAGYRQLVGD
jgi:glycine cleavage system H protein